MLEWSYMRFSLSSCGCVVAATAVWLSGCDSSENRGGGQACGIAEIYRVFDSNCYEEEVVQQVKALLSEGLDVNVKDETGKTPLMLAAQKGYARVGNILIAAGADANAADNAGDTPLILACSGQGDGDIMVPILLEAGADVNAVNVNGETALWKAVMQTNDVELVRLLLSKGADPNVCNKEGVALLLALLSKSGPFNYEMAKVLITGGANPDVVDTLGMTPLHLAVRLKHESLVELLINAGANPNFSANKENGCTPLMDAVLSKNQRILKALIEGGAIVSTKDKNGKSVYSYVGSCYPGYAEYSSRQKVEELLMHGEKLLKQRSLQLVDCVQSGDAKQAERLLAQGADPLYSEYDLASSSSTTCALEQAARMGNVEFVRMFVPKITEESHDKVRWIASESVTSGQDDAAVLLLSHLKVQQNFDSERLLDNAAEHGCIKVVDFLLEHGVEATERCINTACKHGYADIIKLMLSKDVKLTDKCLRVACEYGQVEILKILLEAGADASGYNDYWFVDENKKQEIAAIMNASKEQSATRKYRFLDAAAAGDVDTVKDCLAKGMNPDIEVEEYGKKYYDTNALELAVKGRHAQVVVLLVEAGAATDVVMLKLAKAKDVEGLKLLITSGVKNNYPLEVAVRNNDVAQVQTLLSAGMSATYKKGDWGNSPLEDALSKGNYRIVELMLAVSEVDINADGGKWLRSAVSDNNIELVKVLLKYPGINVNVGEYMHQTPLYIAVEKGNVEMVKLLISVPDIRFDKRDTFGQTLLHHVVERKNKTMLAVLLQTPNINVNALDDMCNTPLHLAAESGDMEILELFLAVPNIDVNFWARGYRNGIRMDMGTALSAACLRGDIAMVKRLLAVPGIDVNAGNGLIYAASKGHEEVVKLLLAAPAINIYSVNGKNRTAMECAREAGHDNIVILLQQAMQK